MKLRHWILFCLLVWSPQAATYYISYSTGSDSNDGSEGSPFQHNPYMKTATANAAAAKGNNNVYLHLRGDTWTTTNFQMRIIHSNTFHGAYGVGNFPLFDFQHTLISDAAGLNSNFKAAAILISGVASTNCDYTTIADLELANLRGRRDQGTGDDYTGIWNICLRGTNSNFLTVSNCLIHDWSLATPVSAGQDGGEHGGIGGKDLISGGITGGRNVRVINTWIHCANQTNKVGVAIKMSGVFSNTIVNDVSIGLLGGGTIVDSFWFNTGMPAADPTGHENHIYNQEISTISGNIFSNIYSAGIYDNSASFRTASSTHYNTNTGVGCTRIFNNIIIMNSGAFGACVDMNAQNLTGGTPEGSTNTAVLVYGNTLVRNANNACVLLNTQAQEPGQKFGLVLMADNHLINSTGTSTAVVLPQESVIETIITFNNLTQSVATASTYGYTLANTYRPIDSTVPTYRTGSSLALVPFNLTIDVDGNLRNDPPDIGGYEFTVPAPPAGLNWGVPNVTIGNLIILKP